jgi:hypothetical protein
MPAARTLEDPCRMKLKFQRIGGVSAGTSRIPQPICVPVFAKPRTPITLAKPKSITFPCAVASARKRRSSSGLRARSELSSLAAESVQFSTVMLSNPPRSFAEVTKALHASAGELDRAASSNSRSLTYHATRRWTSGEVARLQLERSFGQIHGRRLRFVLSAIQIRVAHGFNRHGAGDLAACGPHAVGNDCQPPVRRDTSSPDGSA